MLHKKKTYVTFKNLNFIKNVQSAPFVIFKKSTPTFNQFFKFPTLKLHIFMS